MFEHFAEGSGDLFVVALRHTVKRNPANLMS